MSPPRPRSDRTRVSPSSDMLQDEERDGPRYVFISPHSNCPAGQYGVCTDETLDSPGSSSPGSKRNRFKHAKVEVQLLEQGTPKPSTRTLRCNANVVRRLAPHSVEYWMVSHRLVTAFASPGYAKKIEDYGYKSVDLLREGGEGDVIRMIEESLGMSKPPEQKALKDAWRELAGTSTR
eukprot:COSAG02_NODE_27091_length_617_cov_0.899614_1_plen_178_part_10